MTARLEMHPVLAGHATWLTNLLQHHGIDPWGPIERGCYSRDAWVVLRFELATLGGRIIPEKGWDGDRRLPLLAATHVEFPSQEALFEFLLTWG